MGEAQMRRMAIPVVVLQTIAANLGSMLTPIGNPQNLYLYGKVDLNFGEFMYLFTADGFTGTLKECEEGTLEWVSRDFLDNLPKWEGDQIFLDLLWQDAPFFLLTLRYKNDVLQEAILNGNKIR